MLINCKHLEAAKFSSFTNFQEYRMLYDLKSAKGLYFTLTPISFSEV